MIKIDVLGKPCPIPVIEAKKALAEHSEEVVLIKADNITAVQNLEKMANGYGYGFSYARNSSNYYEVLIARDGKNPHALKTEKKESQNLQNSGQPSGFGIIIGKDTMGSGSDELGKILMKGFIYSLTELSVPPKFIAFLNSGAYLTSSDANTIDDLRRLEQKGTEILTCGTCVNYFGLQDKLAVGVITDMYGITEKMTSASNVINI